MKSVRYAGRNSQQEAGLDDAVPATTIASEVGVADVVFIDDPLSFPWEFTTSPPVAPLIIDIGRCTSDDLVALAPALIHITEYDTIIDRTGSTEQSNRFAHLLGARSAEPTTSELAELQQLKHLHRIEAGILNRLHRDWQTIVVNFADLVTTAWEATKWSDPTNTRPPAVVIRIPIEAIRQRGGLTTMANELVQTVNGTSVLDVWGVRAGPGDPLARGLVVIGVDR